MLGARWATVLSAVLATPLLLLLIFLRLDYEPVFLPLLTNPDGTPTTLGRALMLGVLLSVPIGLVINLLPRLRRSPGRSARFVPTSAHVIIGLAMLSIVMLTTANLGLNELRPFVAPLGPAAFLGQVAFLLMVVTLPVSVLLNRVPRFAAARWDGSPRGRTVVSANVVVGAVLFLLTIMLLSAFALEATACSVGVPNCD
jgi:hypothetical protein